MIALWKVIRRMEMRPTYDLLPPELKKRVLDLWPKISPMLEPVELPWQQNRASAVPSDISASVQFVRDYRIRRAPSINLEQH